MTSTEAESMSENTGNVRIGSHPGLPPFLLSATAENPMNQLKNTTLPKTLKKKLKLRLTASAMILEKCTNATLMPVRIAK